MDNKKIKDISLLISCLASFAYFLIPQITKAMCPVCTVGVIAGLGLSRWLGIDDTVSGIWIGGLTVSLIMWTINWLNKKQINFYAKKLVTIVAYYSIIVLPLYAKEIIGHPFNKFWGIDKLIFGILVGSLFFSIGGISYNILKAKNNNKAYFPFQKVVMPIAPLIILSIIFYFLTKN